MRGQTRVSSIQVAAETQPRQTRYFYPNHFHTIRSSDDLFGLGLRSQNSRSHHHISNGSSFILPLCARLLFAQHYRERRTTGLPVSLHSWGPAKPIRVKLYANRIRLCPIAREQSFTPSLDLHVTPCIVSCYKRVC